MKTSSATLSIICILAAAGLAIWVVVERQARFKLDQENKALHQQLSPMDEIIAENQRLSNLVAHANGSQSGRSEQLKAPAVPDERAKELLRLRGEVDGLRQQNKEIETLREDTREVRAARENGLKMQNAGQAARSNSGLTSNGSQLEVITT
jgi:hypothetical protein